jgi:hypothetical protein
MTTARLRPALLMCVVAAACADEIEIVPEPPREAFPTITPQLTAPPALPRVVPTAEAAAGVARSEPVDDIPRPRPRGCEPGQQVSCFNPPVSMCHGDGQGGQRCAPLMKTCEKFPDGRYRFDDSSCSTPLVVSFHENHPVEFTKPDGSFKIGAAPRTEWVSARTPWLGRDLDRSGCIEGQHELFGPPEDGPGNGFDNIVHLDETRDGLIDARDGVFTQLVLWADANQDRACTPDEIRSLDAAGVVALDIANRSQPAQAEGSYEGEDAPLWFRSAPGEAPRRGRLVDVYLLPLR